MGLEGRKKREEKRTEQLTQSTRQPSNLRSEFPGLLTQSLPLQEFTFRCTLPTDLLPHSPTQDGQNLSLHFPHMADRPPTSRLIQLSVWLLAHKHARSLLGRNIEQRLTTCLPFLEGNSLQLLPSYSGAPAPPRGRPRQQPAQYHDPMESPLESCMLLMRTILLIIRNSDYLSLRAVVVVCKYSFPQSYNHHKRQIWLSPLFSK